MTTVTCPKCSSEIPAGFKFCGECGAKLPTASAAVDTTTSPDAALKEIDAQDVGPRETHRDELRDVTILFADLTGFTAMAERLDPEAVHEIMNACFDGLGRIVQAHGGHVDKYIGDSIMALFGAPTAHEDDPVRAAETAIAMRRFLSEFSKRRGRDKSWTSDFRMRIGLNSGLVLAGAIGTGARRDYSVMGDAVNIASRLEAAAEPGTILVSANFKRRVERLFEFGPARTLQLKGKERPIEAFVLQGEKLPAATAEAESGEPFVGRTIEIEGIRAALRGAQTTATPWIEVRGAMGVGKTRLVEVALSDERRCRPVTVVSRPSTAARPFALMRRILHAVFQEFATSKPPEDRAGLEAALAPVADGLAPYVSAIWYLAAPDHLGVPTPDPDPMTFRRTVERGLEVLFANLARLEKPPLLFLDDYHLSDTETRAFLERAAKSPSGAKLAIVSTVRPEFPPTDTPTTTIHLAGLANAETQDLIRRLTAPTPLTGKIEDDIVHRAGGVPLFVKELVRKHQDDVTESRPDAARGASEGATALPSSLLGLMMSRIDRLEAPMRSFLAQCAVQGPDFSASIASRIWAARGGHVNDANDLIRDLESRQIIRPLGSRSERWTFSQVLMQNACYDQMLRRDRRELHKAVADELVAEAGGATGVSAEILANHYECSEQWLLAAAQNVRAGDRAATLFANADAIARYARAVRAVDEIGERGEADTQTRVAANRGSALVSLRIGDYAASRRYAEHMLDAAVTAAARAEALRLKALGHVHIGELEAADSLLGEAHARASTAEPGSERDSLTSRIAYDHAELCHRLGRNTCAQTHIDHSRSLCGSESAEAIRVDILEGRLRHTEGAFEKAQELYARAYRAARSLGSLSEEALTSNYMGNAARDAGRYGEAEEHFCRALDVWSRTGMTEAIAGAHNNLANLAISRGNHEEASRHYHEALSAFENISNAAGRATALMNLALLAIESREPLPAIERAEAARELLEASGNRMLLGLAHVIKGEALIEAERLDEAHLSFGRVLDDYTEATHPLALAGAHRGLGRLHLAAERSDEAVLALERGLALFERLTRVQEAARTEMHLAEARARAGDTARAHAHLENARRRFAEIGATRDLKRADAVRLDRGSAQ